MNQNLSLEAVKLALMFLWQLDEGTFFKKKNFNVQVKIINSGSKRYEIGRQKILHNAVT